MGLGYIRVDTINPFNKRVMFVFNMRTCLTHLTYKIISYFDIIAQLMVFLYVYYYIYGCNCILILDI